MPEALAPFARAGIQLLIGLYNYLTNSEAQKSIKNALASLFSITGYILRWEHSFTQWVAGIFQIRYATWQDVHPFAVTTAFGIGDTAYNLNEAMRRLVTVILPASQRWMDGHTHQWVDNKYDPQFADFWRWRRAIDVWTVNINTWQRTFVDPNINDWIRFHTFWQSWPLATVTIVHDWLKNPSAFGKWAAQPIAAPLIDYINKGLPRTLLDKLTATIVDATPDVWRDAEQAMVAILLTEQ